MFADILSKYSLSPYTLIGLDLTDQHIFPLSNDESSKQIKKIFYNITDCQNFINNQNQNEKIVLIIAGSLFTDELNKLTNYPQIDSIYLYPKSGNSNEEFQCVYDKIKENNSMQIYLHMLGRFWFLLGLLIVVILAYLFPQIGASDGPLYAKYTVKYGCVMLILLFSSLSLTAKNLYEELHNFRLHLCIQLFSLIFLPFSMFGIILLLAQTSMNKTLLHGLILMACTPTGITINIMATADAGGNEYGTLLNGLFGSFTGVFVSPGLVSIFMQIFSETAVKQSYDIHHYGRVIGNLCITALLPVFVGQIINFIWTEKIMWAKTKFHFSKIVGFALIILLWTVVSDLFKSNLLETINTIDLLIIALLNIVFFVLFTFLAFLIARLPNICICQKPEINHDHQPLLPEHESKAMTLIKRWRFTRENTITFMFCAVTKSLSLGLPLITAIYSDHQHGHVGFLSLPLIFYHVELLILCSIEVLCIRHWYPPKQEVNA